MEIEDLDNNKYGRWQCIWWVKNTHFGENQNSGMNKTLSEETYNN